MNLAFKNVFKSSFQIKKNNYTTDEILTVVMYLLKTLLDKLWKKIWQCSHSRKEKCIQ